jgi:hypothetical protein
MKMMAGAVAQAGQTAVGVHPTAAALVGGHAASRCVRPRSGAERSTDAGTSREPQRCAGSAPCLRSSCSRQMQPASECRYHQHAVMPHHPEDRADTRHTPGLSTRTCSDSSRKTPFVLSDGPSSICRCHRSDWRDGLRSSRTSATSQWETVASSMERCSTYGRRLAQEITHHHGGCVSIIDAACMHSN